MFRHSSRLTAAALLVVTVSACGSLTVDQERLEADRETVRTLCADPVTTVGKALCDRLVAGEPVTLEPAPPQ